MITLLHRYFAYPTLPSEAATERARVFHRVAIGVLGIALPFLLLLVLMEPATLARRLVSMGLLVVLVLPLLEINRRGRARLAGALLLTGLTLIVTRSAWTAGGFATPFGYLLVFLVGLAGLLFSARGVVVWGIVLSLVGLALVVLAGKGLLPAPELAYTHLTTWLFAVACIFMSVLVQREVSATVGRSLRHAAAEIQSRKQAQDRLRLAIGAGDLGVWVLDVQDRCFHADPNLFELYAIALSDDRRVPYAVWNERIHPEDRAMAEAMLNDALAGKSDARVEFRIVRPDGSVRHVETTGILERGEEHGARSVVGMTRDVTAAKRAALERERLVHDLGERVKELGLLHSAARLLQPDRPFERELFEQLVAWIPPAWQYPECCEARLMFRDMTVATPGWRETQWMQSIEFRVSDSIGRIDVAYLEPRPAEAEGPFLAEERVLLGSLAEMLVSYVELRRYREELEAQVATRTREMRAARDEAERANRAKGDFLATMSHEIRTPMNAILGYTQLLRRDAALAQTHRDRLDAILSSGDHLLTLINNVLDMSKIDAGKTTLVVAPFDLHALLDEVQKMFAALVAAKSLELVFEGAFRLPRVVQADAGRVRQVLINMLSNALKFTRYGSIRVGVACSSTPQGHQVTIAVTDSGAGIHPEQLSRVFGVFEQSAIGVHAGGAGLGLPISRELARLMGGDLTVSSEEGVGSTFTFSFDAGVADALVAAQARRVLGIKSRRRPKVLVVDDQPDNLTIADELLRSVGFETRLAMRGDEALSVFAEWQPDAALMDVRMPGMSGTEVIRRLRADGIDTPVVVFTASGLDTMAVEARAAGANDVLFKPCKDAEMLAVFSRLLDIEYIHEVPAGSAAAGFWEQGAVTVSLQELGDSVPRALLDELLVATVQARTAQVERLASEVARYSAAAAERIRKLLREFRYEELLAALRAAGAGNQ